MQQNPNDLPPGVFPEETGVDGDFLNQLSAEAIQYIHEDAREQIVDVLTNTDNTTEAVAATTYKITKGLLERHKTEAMDLEADMSHAVALATEVTDMLVEVVEAVQPDAAMDTDKLREEALMRATVMHGENLEQQGDPQQKEEAQVIYARMMQEGTVDEAFSYVNKKAEQHGINTNDMMRKGNELSQPFLKQQVDQNVAKQKPLAAAVSQATQAPANPPPPEPQPQPVMGAPEQAAPPPEPQPMAAQPAPPNQKPLMEGM